MLSPANTSLVIFLLGACCVGCVLTVALYPFLSKVTVPAGAHGTGRPSSTRFTTASAFNSSASAS